MKDGVPLIHGLPISNLSDVSLQFSHSLPEAGVFQFLPLLLPVIQAGQVKDGVPLIHGLPISNLSDGELLELCVDITVSRPGQLGIILVDGAERLDSRTRTAETTSPKALIPCSMYSCTVTPGQSSK